MKMTHQQTSNQPCLQANKSEPSLVFIRRCESISINGFENIFTKLCLWTISLCFANFASAQISPNTQISLNSDGTLVAIGYVDKSNNEVVDIARLSEMPNLKAKRLALGKLQAFTIAFGIEPEILLITTRGKNGSDLLRVNVTNTNNPKIEKLYSHPILLRFPVEVNGNKYIFLEQIDLSNGDSRWMAFDGARSYVANETIFGRAAPPSIVNGNIFLPIPFSNPTSITDIVGRTPESIKEFYSNVYASMNCVGALNLFVCLRSDATVLLVESYSELVVNNNGNRCKIPGQWRDLRSITIAANGRYGAFHAIPRGKSQREVHLVGTSDKSCTTNIINITWES